MPLEVVLATTDEQRQIAYSLRYDAFIVEQKGDPEFEIDEYDSFAHTRHFLGRDTESGKFVATARCAVFVDRRRGKIGRVVVHRECRGKNYGATLMAAVESAMRDQCDSFELSAQFDKRAFYEKCGYSRADDEVYLEGKIVHCKMVKHG